MPVKRKKTPEWKEFEQLVARIERDTGPLGLEVRAPDKILCKVTGRMREVDASIRSRTGTAEILVTVECRRRHPKQDVTWIEQLATKRNNIGASCTIAVSSSGFSENAQALALHHGIQLRNVSELSASEINRLIAISFVWFTHKRVALAGVGLRFAKTGPWKMPNPAQVDMELPETVDFHANIFRNVETGYTWSLNDVWHQIQEAADPYADIAKGHPPPSSGRHCSPIRTM